jgi:hypothetical protein
MPQRQDFSERAGGPERLGGPPHVVQYIREQSFPDWRARYAGYSVPPQAMKGRRPYPHRLIAPPARA